MNKTITSYLYLLFFAFIASNSLLAQTPVVFDPPIPDNITVECDAIPPAATVTATGCNAPGPFAYINEIHYDNTGGDVGEFIEIVGLAGTNLAGYQLLAYDSDDLLDAQVTLSGVIPDEGGGFGALAFFLADLNSQFFENGPEEGRALMQTGVGVVHFISYEGVVNAANGPAAGLTSFNIGTEPSGTPIGQSLQATGGPGCLTGDFTWVGPLAESPGLINAGQTFDLMACPGNNSAAVTLSESIVPGPCAGEYSLLRTYTAVDNCGTTASFTQTVNVEDTTPPTFCNAPADISLDCSATAPAAPVVTAVDNCFSTMASVWINELHYDNSGTDAGEFVEVAGAAGFDLSACQIALYNGANGTVYNTISLAGVIPNEDGSFGAVDFPLPVNGLQNGSPDGLALVCGGTVLEFLSYEGTLTATNGPANGMTSTDIGVTEGSGTQIGQSLQLTGCGTSAWAGPIAESPGALNDGQDIGDPVSTTMVETVPDGPCSSFTRTWTAIDDCGNEATHTQTITFTDTTPPVITCPPSALGLSCNQNPPAAATNAAEFIALGGTISDDCANLNDLTVVSMISDNGGTNCPGDGLVITRTYTIIDVCGNASSCTQDFTYLESTSDPVITSILPNCYKYCGSLANPLESDITYTTDCNFGATVNITGPVVIGPENCPGTIYRYTYTVTDDCGRTSQPWVRDFIIGNEGPEIECAPFNLILECGDPNNQDYIDAHLAQVSATTSCEMGVNITHFPTNFNLFSCGSATVVTFTATDDCGRTATCTTTIAVQDNTAPTITNIPPSLCDATECGGDVDYWFDHWVDYMLTGLEATDACNNNVSLTTIPSNPQLNTDCDPVTGDAITTVTFVANDNCGNTSTHVGTFTVENEFPAAFENVPADATVSCDDPIVFGPTPDVVNECNTTVTFEDTVDDSDPCNVLYTRTWTATDACGGLTTTAAQTITEVDDEAPVISGGADITVECDGLGNEAMLQAWVDSNAGATAADACGNGENWTSNFDDLIDVILTPDCGGGVIAYIDVTFTATDNCNNGSSITHRFNIEDTTAPTFDNTPVDGTIACDETPTFDTVTATDLCTDAIVTFEDTQDGDSCDGSYTRTWTATDLCGNSATVSQTFSVSDTEAPVFTSVPTGGNVQCITDISGDAEATDNCSTPTITSSDEVTGDDCSGTVVRTWTATDDCGNSSTASATYTYEDTEAPTASNVPADMTISCTDPVVFGADPTWTDNCDSDVFNSFEDIETPGDCPGNYTIERFWAGIDECGNLGVVSQTITVEDNTGPVFTFVPSSGTIECEIADIADAEASDDCGSVTITHEDVITGQACAGTLTRTWTATDECGNTTTASADFEITDEEAPVFTYVPEVADLDCDEDLTPEPPIAEDNCGNVTVEITDDTNINGDLCDDGYAHVYVWTATDDCGNTATVETIVWVNPDDEAPVFIYVPEVADLDCDEDLTPEPPVAEDNCGNVTIEITDDTNINGDLCDDGYAHVYEWTATDDCGNTATVETIVWVNPDNEAPVFTFVPEGDLITCDEFPPTFGDVIVEDNCSSFTLTYEDQYVGNPNGCDDGENFDYRRWWTATDACGNESTAKQTFWVKAEEPAANVSGLITTEMDDAVEDVTVTLEGGIGGYTELYVTADDGMYGFADLPLESNYTITPESNVNPMNGVSTYDLVLISKHILEVQQLDSPYKMIAADINKSGSISTLDLIELRKMILFINLEFPNNDSWRFVEASFVFPYADNPFATSFPETTSINGLLEDEVHDYIAVKIGDVNGTAVANSLMGGEDRSFNGNLNFNVNDQLMEAGETYEVAFTSDNFDAIAGYQYSLTFDETRLEVMDIVAGNLEGLSDANFGWTKVEEGVITTSWNSNEGVRVAADEAIFTITFKAKASTQLSEALDVSSIYTTAEAYNAKLDLMEVDLRFDGSTLVADFDLQQNRPNPFKQSTVIGFSLPAASNATLTFYDVSGKVLKQVNGDFNKGYNEVSINRNELQTTGLVYYELVTPTHTATKRMLLANN